MTVFGINIDRKQLLLLVLDGLLILLAMSLAHLLRLNQALTPENLAMQLSTRTGASLLAVLAHIGALYVLESYKLADDWSRPRHKCVTNIFPPFPHSQPYLRSGVPDPLYQLRRIIHT
jgi:hypothetical protein